MTQKKIQETKLHFELNYFTQKLDFDVLWFSRRRVYTGFGKKKKGKKTLITAKIGMVGIKGYFKDI